MSRGLSKYLTIAIILVAIAALCLPALFLLMFSSCPVGKFSFLGEAPVLADLDIPQHVAEDAEILARELVGDDAEEREELIAGLLAVYSVARDRDFLIVCNPGGFGRESDEVDSEWGSVIAGIESTLEEMGYTAFTVEYIRTPDGFWHYLKEFRETMLSYPKKAKMLRAKIDFLTQHVDNLKVILAGNSDGGVYTNEVMRLLEGNLRVYGIECGVPFYYRGSVPERTLVINDNGVTPDVLAKGNVASLIWSNITHFPKNRAPEGHIALYLRARGHIYTWDHPGVGVQITSFLKDNFGGN